MGTQDNHRAPGTEMVLTWACSCGAFHRQPRVTAPSRCSTVCRAAPAAPPAPTSSTVLPPARHKASRYGPAPAKEAPQKSRPGGSRQGCAMPRRNRSSSAAAGSSPRAQAVRQTAGFKLFPGDSLIPVSKCRSSGFLVFYLHESFHSYLLPSTFDLPLTVLLQKSFSPQLRITRREATSETLPSANSVSTHPTATCLNLPFQCQHLLHTIQTKGFAPQLSTGRPDFSSCSH